MLMAEDIKLINEKVAEESAFVERVMAEVGRVIVGQTAMVERLLVGMLCNGHVLLEGVPGLAKTLAVTTLAQTIQATFSRIQFTPDLLPADLVGTMIYNQQTGDFVAKKGPIFAQIILADEVNRAPAKVQSAMLEAMQEHQVTIGDQTYPMSDPFLVLATQNPIEQEGTYPLPEAQVDRFMLKVKVTYPSREEERAIIDRMSEGEQPVAQPVLTPADILRARSVVDQVYIDAKIKNYIVDLMMATRDPASYGLNELSTLIEYGCSPRGSICLTRAAKAHAFLRRRGYVTPEDVKAVGMDVLRHRLIVTYEAEAEEKAPEDLIRTIFDHIEVP
jgi:MoxR-like ATPase